MQECQNLVRFSICSSICGHKHIFAMMMAPTIPKLSETLLRLVFGCGCNSWAPLFSEHSFLFSNFHSDQVRMNFLGPQLKVNIRLSYTRTLLFFDSAIFFLKSLKLAFPNNNLLIFHASK